MVQISIPIGKYLIVRNPPKKILMVKSQITELHWPTKNTFSQNALEFYAYSGAEWCPKHDVAFSFSLN